MDIVSFKKKFFIDSFNVEDYNKEVVSSIENFEKKMTGQEPVSREDLKKLISHTLDVTYVDISEMKDLSNVFSDSKYEYLDLSNWDFENITDMSEMFLDSERLKKIIFGEPNTENVSDFSAMLSGCHKLEEVDIEGLNTSSLNYMEEMFYGCKKIKYVFLETFSPDNLFDSPDVFCGCNDLLEVHLPLFSLEDIRQLKGSFFDCDSLKEVFFEEGVLTDYLELEELIGFGFDCNLEKDFDKVYEVDSDLLELTYEDAKEELSFYHRLKNKGNYEIFKKKDSEDCVVKDGKYVIFVVEKELEVLKDRGLLKEYKQEQKAESLVKNKTKIRNRM